MATVAIREVAGGKYGQCVCVSIVLEGRRVPGRDSYTSSDLLDRQ